MGDFASSWKLSRQRFVDTIFDLNDAQINWRLHDQALTIGQMAIHVAGVETSFGSQLSGQPLDEEASRIKSCATDGVVNDKPFPYSDSEISQSKVQDALSRSQAIVEPLISDPSSQVLSKELVSALGPIITGEGAFTRLAFHAAYHQGQAYLIRTAPGFPDGSVQIG